MVDQQYRDLTPSRRFTSLYVTAPVLVAALLVPLVGGPRAAQWVVALTAGLASGFLVWLVRILLSRDKSATTWLSVGVLSFAQVAGLYLWRPSMAHLLGWAFVAVMIVGLLHSIARRNV